MGLRRGNMMFGTNQAERGGELEKNSMPGLYLYIFTEFYEKEL